MSVGRFVLPVGVAGVRYHLGGILLVLALAFVVPTCVAALLGARAGPSMDSFTSWRWVHRGFALDRVCERTPVRRVWRAEALGMRARSLLTTVHVGSGYRDGETVP